MTYMMRKMSTMCFFTNCRRWACSVARVLSASPRGDEGEMGDRRPCAWPAPVAGCPPGPWVDGEAGAAAVIGGDEGMAPAPVVDKWRWGCDMACG